MLDVGAQIVALNTQTKDYFAWMMYGYFCGGRSEVPPSIRGYVLKPKHLRPSKDEIVLQPKAKYKLRI